MSSNMQTDGTSSDISYKLGGATLGSADCVPPQILKVAPKILIFSILNPLKI